VNEQCQPQGAARLGEHQLPGIAAEKLGPADQHAWKRLGEIVYGAADGG